MNAMTFFSDGYVNAEALYIFPPRQLPEFSNHRLDVSVQARTASLQYPSLSWLPFLDLVCVSSTIGGHPTAS
jgi:hypothetical protein